MLGAGSRESFNSLLARELDNPERREKDGDSPTEFELFRRLTAFARMDVDGYPRISSEMWPGGQGQFLDFLSGRPPTTSELKYFANIQRAQAIWYKWRHPQFYNQKGEYDRRKYWSWLRHKIAPWLSEAKWKMDRSQSAEILRLLNLRSTSKERKRAIVLIDREYNRSASARPASLALRALDSGIVLPQGVFSEICVVRANSGPWPSREARSYDDSTHRAGVTRWARILRGAKGGRPRACVRWRTDPVSGARLNKKERTTSVSNRTT